MNNLLTFTGSVKLGALVATAMITYTIIHTVVNTLLGVLYGYIMFRRSTGEPDLRLYTNSNRTH